MLLLLLLLWQDEDEGGAGPLGQLRGVGAIAGRWRRCSSNCDLESVGCCVCVDDDDDDYTSVVFELAKSGVVCGLEK
jgi:hypothetical protein